MKDLKGTKTEKNLMEAFAGESMARNKYTFFASKAKKDGYVQISKIFEETAANEKEHAELWYKFLNGGKISGTEANLADAAAGENAEWTDMYVRMAKEADEEGFHDLAEQLSPRQHGDAHPAGSGEFRIVRVDGRRIDDKVYSVRNIRRGLRNPDFRAELREQAKKLCLW